MLPELSDDQRTTAVGALHEVATAKGTRTLTPADEAALEGAWRWVLGGGATPPPPADGLPDVWPADLARAFDDRDLAHLVGGLLAVMPFVDGTVDEDRIAIVLAYAEALRIDEPYVRDLAELMAHHMSWVVADMSRQNLESITNHPWAAGVDVNAWLLPYRGEAADPAVEARYQGLRELPEGTFGRAFANFYDGNGFVFPGAEAALQEQFGTPHDSAHVLSGYDTTPQGELLVSTFTSTMHAEAPLAGHVLPVILSWHVGIRFNDVAGATTGALDPEKLWVAWRRGADCTLDTFGRDWDFWANVERPLDEVRDQGRIAPLEARYAAAWREPGSWTPIA